MNIKALATFGGSLVLLIGAICALPDTSDARRIGGFYGRPYAHGAYVRRYPAARAAYWRSGRYWRPGRWVNGVWVVNGVAASVAAGTASNCGYYWNRWQATGRPYWRERYNEMCG